MLTGLNEVILREAFIEGWFRSCERRQWADMIRAGKITREKLIEQAGEALKLSDQEVAAKQASYDAAKLNQDQTDLSQYRLKQLIEVGDEWVCNETKTFMSSRAEYLTAGKRYRVKTLDDKREDLADFSMTTETNMPEETHYGSNLSINSLWRDGKEIWNWNDSYYETFKEFYPETDPVQLEELRQHCLKGAERDRKRERK